MLKKYTKKAMLRVVAVFCMVFVCAGFIVSGTMNAIAAETEPMNGFERVSGDSYSASSPSRLIKQETALKINIGSQWVQYKNVELADAEADQLQINLAAAGDAGLQVWLGEEKVFDGEVPSTGSPNTYKTQKLNLPQNVTGKFDVKIVFVSGDVSIRWFKFVDTTNVPVLPEVSATYDKPRVININDMIADKDDEQSLVRMLVMANTVDLEGIIVGTSCWRPNQDINETRGMDKTMEIIEAYGKVVENLQKHAKGYPSLEQIKGITVYGQQKYGMSDVGAGKTSAGAQLIIDAVFKAGDERPVWVNCWGGANTVAQAVWQVANGGEYTEEELEYFISKLRVFDVLGQDDAGAWLAKNYPDLLYIRSLAVYGTGLADGTFYDNNVQNHGVLGAVYPDPAWTYEGDTPSFLYQIPTGMNDPEHLDWGSWGGRFNTTKSTNVKPMSGVKTEDQYKPFEMYTDSSDGANAIKRWSVAIQNDFAARMDWTLTDDYSEANHHPIAVLNDDTTTKILFKTAAPGEVVSLSAVGSSDPDGDNLSYKWSVYNEPSTCKNASSANSTSENASVTIPSGAAKGSTIHVILEVIDDGDPALYAYRRLVITVG